MITTSNRLTQADTWMTDGFGPVAEVAVFALMALFSGGVVSTVLAHTATHLLRQEVEVLREGAGVGVQVALTGWPIRDRRGGGGIQNRYDRLADNGGRRPSKKQPTRMQAACK